MDGGDDGLPADGVIEIRLNRHILNGHFVFHPQAQSTGEIENIFKSRKTEFFRQILSLVTVNAAAIRDDVRLGIDFYDKRFNHIIKKRIRQAYRPGDMPCRKLIR